MKKQKGFSLIELLIVVAIILIIAAIAVPNLLRSRMAANESSAAGSERTIATSNVTYSTTYGIGYAGTLAQLGPNTTTPTAVGSATSDLLDATLSAATVSTAPKSGYFFTYAATPGGTTPTSASQNTSFTVLAQPASASTGVSAFCVDQSNVVRKNPTGSTTGATSATTCGTMGQPL